jgi:hypothetical protein
VAALLAIAVGAGAFLVIGSSDDDAGHQPEEIAALIDEQTPFFAKQKTGSFGADDPAWTRVDIRDEPGRSTPPFAGAFIVGRDVAAERDALLSGSAFDASLDLDLPVPDPDEDGIHWRKGAAGAWCGGKPYDNVVLVFCTPERRKPGYVVPLDRALSELEAKGG